MTKKFWAVVVPYILDFRLFPFDFVFVTRGEVVSGLKATVVPVLRPFNDRLVVFLSDLLVVDRLVA